MGAVPSPFDSFLVLRGTKTLHIRMREHEQNALQIAKWLETHPKVERVLYPGLPSHPQHSIAKKQQKGFGVQATIFSSLLSYLYCLTLLCRFCCVCVMLFLNRWDDYFLSQGWTQRVTSVPRKFATFCTSREFRRSGVPCGSSVHTFSLFFSLSIVSHVSIFLWIICSFRRSSCSVQL